MSQIKVKSIYEEMIEKFQCPGCAVGGPGICDTFKEKPWGHSCDSHVCGTMFGLGNVIALGLPTGFNHPTICDDKGQPHTKMIIAFWDIHEKPEWNHLNVSVWALERDGYLFVRTYMPRVGKTRIDVIKNGKLDFVPNAINVAEFYDDID